MISRLSYKISIPIILAGIFVATIFISFNYESLNWSFYVVLLGLVLFVFFFGFAMGQNLASPVRKILSRAIDLNNGDLKTRVYLETKDELAELARTFNEIAEKLEESRANEEKAQSSVGIKVRAKTQALEETITALEQKIRNRTAELQKLADEAKKMQEKTGVRESEVAELKRQINTLKASFEKSRINKETKNESK